MASLLLLALVAAPVLVIACYAQNSNVLTGHNDTYRTGWQQSESTLSPSAVNQNSFGLLWQYEVNGAVFAQPLAYHSSQQIGSGNSCTNCDVVFIADEQDYVYAFEADTSSQQLPWSADLAPYWPCLPSYPLPCGKGVINPDMGITSTPAIDAANQIIYVVALESISGSPEYYLSALNLQNGAVLASTPISASYTGVNPGPITGRCSPGRATKQIRAAWWTSGGCAVMVRTTRV